MKSEEEALGLETSLLTLVFEPVAFVSLINFLCKTDERVEDIVCRCKSALFDFDNDDGVN